MMRRRQGRRRNKGMAVVILQIGRGLVRPRGPSRRQCNWRCSGGNRRGRSSACEWDCSRD